jgi:hypothetical protein
MPVVPSSLVAWSGLQAAVAPFVVTRAAIGLAAWLGAAALPRRYHQGLFTEVALGWDGAWYAGIARDGYSVPPTGASNLAFPPLLPLLTGLLGRFLHLLGLDVGDPAWGPWALAGVLISNTAFFAALVVIWHLVRRDQDAVVADWTLWLVAAGPLSIFWSLLYTESLFLLLAASCIWAARQGRWLLAGVCGALALLTRWAGVVLIVVMLVEWLASRRKQAGITAAPPDWQRAPGPGLAGGWIALAPLSLAGYLLYVQATFNNLWIVLQARTYLGQQLSFFPLTYATGISRLWQSLTQTGPERDLVLQIGYGNSLYMWLDLGLPLLFTGLGILGWRCRWLRPGDLALLGLGIIFALSFSTTFSVARYMMVLWPTLIVVGRLSVRYPTLGRAWLVGSTCLMALTAFLFANERWIG